MSAAAANGSSGLEVLLSTLQNAGDIESTLNVLNVLDELLSAGSDRRVRHMIAKGGSQALLTALVKTARCPNPNYTLLLPLLHLLAKLGCRDRRIGLKAEDADAVLLTLNLLRQNCNHARISAACLMVLRVFCSSVTTANLLGEHRALDTVYRLIPPHTGRHLTTVKAAIDALAALLCTKANVRSAVSKGFVSGLLALYEVWHRGDPAHRAVGVRLALLRCLNQVAHSSAGREAVVAHGGVRLLFRTTQACLSSQGPESLVEPSVQLMRKCLPRTPLPLRSDNSAYSFPLPGRDDPSNAAVASDSTAESGEEESEDEDNEDEGQESDSRDFDDDLETDLNKLRSRPAPDRPAEQLARYNQFCPELTHDFQELESGSEPEGSSSSSSTASYSSSSSSSSSDEEAFLRGCSPPPPPPPPCLRRDGEGRVEGGGGDSPSNRHTRSPESQSSSGSLHTAGEGPQVAQLEPRDFQSGGSFCNDLSWRTRSMDKSKDGVSPAQGEETGGETAGERERREKARQSSLVERLLASRGARVPHHDPALYRAAAALTHSIPGFSILAFPDFWGHLPPPGPEPMAPRRPNVQRQKVLEDVQRLFDEDLINQTVFDLEDARPQCITGRADALRFFSKFECGNLRKAVQIRRFEYDLILNADANCSTNTQWFYFEVSNMAAGVPYRFNVINCEKTNSQFNYGMQPVLYSVREALDGRPHWVRTGTEICYFRNHFCPARSRRGQTFYTLTFTVTFKHKEDVCYLAYHYPYTYSALQSHLQVLERSLDPAKVFFRQQSLCSSLAGNPCPLVTITACPASRGNRPCLVLTARVHPSESNASWVMRGTLGFLCSADPAAQSLREAFVFKVIPMLNPDGVVNGTHRCALNGEDLNRQWSAPSAVLSPTIYHTKGLLYYLNSIGRTPLVFCDYHGHSRKKNCFLYGCSVKETLWQSGSAVDTVGLKEDPGYRTIPKTLDRIAPAFSFNSCNYLVEKSRSATARVVVWREMGVLRSYTMESTYNGCDQGIYKGLQTGTRELEEMGVKFCHSLLSLRRDVSALYSKTLINHIHLDPNVLDHKSHHFFEDDEPPCPEEIEYSEYSCPGPSGAQLDLDIHNNSSSSSSEGEEGEEEEEEEGNERGGTSHRPRGDSEGSRLKSRPFPRLITKGSAETLDPKRSPCGRQYLG